MYNNLERYFHVQLPLCKMDIIAIPGLATVRAADNWGALVFKYNFIQKLTQNNI